jgi:membrane-associated phospholipid phosphatase
MPGKLRPVDTLIILFGTMMCVICIAMAGKIGSWYLLVGGNAVMAGGIAVLALLNGRFPKSRAVKIVYNWYPVPLIFLIFKEVYVIIQSGGLSDHDPLLIAIDRFLFFGANPTDLLYHISFPLLTEVLQIAYVSYYFIMIAVAAELYMKESDAQFRDYVFLIVYGFFLSYIGYLLLPGVGPRFTLYDFSAIDRDLPGLWLTPAIRGFLNAGESIPTGVANAVAFAQRDVFPSGHTEMTLIALYAATIFKIRSRYVLYVFGTLLIISTVYLRYHYVVDLLGGAAVCWFTVKTGPWVEKRLGGAGR